jgi:hypothetical protein
MEQCFLCGKPALKMVEIKVGSSSTSIRHHDHHDHHDHGLRSHSHLDHGTTDHYALKPLCADCIRQREQEAAEAAKALGEAGALVIRGMGAGLKLIALVGCLGPLVIAAIGGTLFYFFGQR